MTDKNKQNNEKETRMSVHDELEMAQAEDEKITLRRNLMFWGPIGTIFLILLINVVCNLLT